jgi:hypothetical protein
MLATSEGPMSSNPSTSAFIGLAVAALAACSSRGSATAAPAIAEQPIVAVAPTDAQDEMARNAVRELQHLIASGKGPHLARVPPAELDRATLGPAVPIYGVRLARLEGYEPSLNPRNLLTDDHRFIYPVLSNGRVSASIILARGPAGDWRPEALGHVNLSGAMESVGSRIVSQRGPTQFSLIEIKPLHLRLLSHDEAGRMMVTPLRTVSETSLHVGEPIDAVLAFSELARYASAHPGSSDTKAD